MVSLSQLLFRSARSRYALALCVAGLNSCQFNTDIPLHNNPPRLASLSAIKKMIFYPDSALCTLAVTDLNDTGFNVRVCIAADSSDTSCSIHSLPWLGSYRCVNLSPGTFNLFFGLDTCRMGLYCGHIHIEDPEMAGAKVPFAISFKAVDMLRDSIKSGFWMRDSDRTDITFSPENGELQFLFSKASDSTSALARSPAATGIRSQFKLSGDLETSIKFQLRDDMVDGFEVAFYLSTSPLSGPWDGDIAGFYVTGLTNHVRLAGTSIDMQTDSRDIPYFAGKFAGGRLLISRRADTVGYTFIPSDSSIPMTVLNRLTFPADSAVFVHCRMSVADRLRFRHCLWSDFEVTQGTLSR
jgi:hypothetical protein